MLAPMKYLPNRTAWSIVLIVSLLAILALLAVLQYRWSGEVSQAERERMQTSLQNSTQQFRQEFNRELQQLAVSFQPDASFIQTQDWDRYARAVDELFSSSDRRLVDQVYLWTGPGEDSEQLMRFDRTTKTFSPASWVPAFEPVHERFARNPISMPRGPGEGRPFSWTLFPRIPLLIHPMVVIQPQAGPPMVSARFVGYVLLKLSMDGMRDDLFGELAQRYFSGPDGFIYDVAVVSGPGTDSIIYKSTPNLNSSVVEAPDSRIVLLDPGRPRQPRRTGIGGDPKMFEDARPPGPPPGMGMIRQGRGRGAPVVMAEGEGTEWDLVAKHHGGSLETVVASMRRRNLAVSFGILLLLGTSMALILGYTQRAQRLAQVQMDFVAGVSHELRTPLAVICSAGDNLADGIVADSGPRTREYGNLIRDEGRKLSGMLEQVMQYASIQSGRRQYGLQPACVAEICENTLAKVMPLIAAGGFEVEKKLDPALPLVNVDTTALSQCIQNLINNALKYSGESHWLSISTESAQGKNGMEVAIIVEDRGLGIDPDDLPQIFDPFYRGQKAIAGQIHGTGLGLSLTRKTVAAMGGRITVTSTPGKGSRFTIYLPALPPDAVDSLS